MNTALLGLAVFSLFIDLLTLGVVLVGGRVLEKLIRTPIGIPVYMNSEQDVAEEELM